MTVTERDALLRVVLAQPECDAARLVYADWLQEYGDDADRARAEFIRLTCRPKMPHTTLTRVDRDGLGWDVASGGAGVVCVGSMCHAARSVAADLLTCASEVTIRRGFVEYVTCAGDDWCAHADAILASHPVREVTLTSWPDLPHRVRRDDGWPVLAFEVAGEVVEVAMRGGPPDPADFALLVLSRRWDGVTFHPPQM
jgi:uncharacterized protein (TIGR02996 family)